MEQSIEVYVEKGKITIDLDKLYINIWGEAGAIKVSGKTPIDFSGARISPVVF